MAIAQGGVREVVDQRVEQREHRDRKCKRTFRADEQCDPQKHAEGENQITEDDDANEEGVCATEVGERMFGACPGGDDFSGGETKKKRRFLLNERIREKGLFVEVGVFADLRIVARFLKAGDASEAADGVFVKNVVVADPEFKRKT